MLPSHADKIVREILIALSAGDYVTAIAKTDVTRCTATDIARIVTDYGQVFSAPPFAEWDVVAIDDGNGFLGWSVRAPLWCPNEGGRSDLELVLTVKIEHGKTLIEFDDILVL